MASGAFVALAGRRTEQDTPGPCPSRLRSGAWRRPASPPRAVSHSGDPAVARPGHAPFTVRRIIVNEVCWQSVPVPGADLPGRQICWDTLATVRLDG